jgi:SAM-dependent methyltransferase
MPRALATKMRSWVARRDDADVPSRPISPGWLQFPGRRPDDVSVKPPAYLPIYEQLLADRRERSFSMLELGVWKGDSLAMWRDCLPHATIVGVDLTPLELDLGPRVKVVTGDQTDAALMARLRALYAPDGFEIIVDDASHIGELSAQSLQALYREHLRPGGLYIIEDWGAGYLSGWPDGATLAEPVGEAHLARCEPRSAGATESDGTRLRSHDYGLVGLVKRLVDHTAALTLSVHQPDRIEDPLPIEWMRIHDGVVILRKPDSSH